MIQDSGLATQFVALSTKLKNEMALVPKLGMSGWIQQSIEPSTGSFHVWWPM